VDERFTPQGVRLNWRIARVIEATTTTIPFMVPLPPRQVSSLTSVWQRWIFPRNLDIASGGVASQQAGKCSSERRDVLIRHESARTVSDERHISLCGHQLQRKAPVTVAKSRLQQLRVAPSRLLPWGKMRSSLKLSICNCIVSTPALENPTGGTGELSHVAKRTLVGV
jgi:hypothetical protein